MYKHHKANYNLGDRELKPEERVIVGTRLGPKEPRRIAKHMGVSAHQPQVLIDHKIWSDKEYLPTFMAKRCLEREEFFRYKDNYTKPNGERVWGEGLKGRVVYLVHTFSDQYDPQALDKMNEFIAWTAKYNGAEAVVLVAYTLDHSAQERGIHQTDHLRMQSEEAMSKFDGQAPISQLQLKQYATAGIDTIITPHNHCPEDTQRLCDEVNEEIAPLHEKSLKQNSTMRYKLKFVHIDLAPMLGTFVSDFGKSHLGFDLSDGGKNVLFMGPDKGAVDFVKGVRKYSGLENSALAIMDKKRAENGSNIKIFSLSHAENLTEERGIERMYVLVPDDSIRSGRTMQKNIDVLRGMNVVGLRRDLRIKGVPARVAVYATRTNFAGNSIGILSSPSINDVVITNADPRGIRNVGALDQKTQMIWINFMMAEAAKAVERGEDPNDILTADYIRRRNLLKVDIPHGHQNLADSSLMESGIL